MYFYQTYFHNIHLKLTRLELTTERSRQTHSHNIHFKMIGLVRASYLAQTVKSLSTMRETWVRSLSWEDFLEKETETHSSTLALKIPWKEERGAGYCPWGRKESGTTERPYFTSICPRARYIVILVKTKHCRKEHLSFSS